MTDQQAREAAPALPSMLGEVPMASPVALPMEANVPPVIPRRPRVWTVFAVFLIALVAMVIANVVCLLASGVLQQAMQRLAGHSTESPLDFLASHPETLVWATFCGLFVCLAIALLMAALSPEPLRDRIRWCVPAISRGQMAWGAVGALAIGWMYSMADILGFVPRSHTLETLGHAILNLSGVPYLLTLFVVGIMPGFTEEILFRGYMQTRLSRRWGASVSILVTSLMFGAYHMEFAHAIFAIVMGIYLGALAERAGSILPCVIAHAFNNTVAVLLPDSGALESRPVAMILLATGAVVLAVCVSRVWRQG